MSAASELIRAIAAILWPLFAFFAVFLFRAELSTLLKTIRRGKLFGQELEIGEALENLNKSATLARQDVAALPMRRPTKSAHLHDNDIQEVLAEMSRSPRAALLRLGNYIERETDRLLACYGQSEDGENDIRNHTLPKAVALLGERLNSIPASVRHSIADFSHARAQLVHGTDANNEEVLRAIDSGLTILKSLKAVPREVNVVRQINVPIYHDDACTIRIEQFDGIILDAVSPSGLGHSYRIFPTTKKHFQIGRQVAYQWDLTNTCGQAWYCPTDGAESVKAWDSAGEFIGRLVD